MRNVNDNAVKNVSYQQKKTANNYRKQFNLRKWTKSAKLPQVQQTFKWPTPLLTLNSPNSLALNYQEQRKVKQNVLKMDIMTS